MNKRIGVESVITAVCEEFGVDYEDDIIGPKLNILVTRARQTLTYLCYTELGMTQNDIAETILFMNRVSVWRHLVAVRSWRKPWVVRLERAKARLYETSLEQQMLNTIQQQQRRIIELEASITRDR